MKRTSSYLMYVFLLVSILIMLLFTASDVHDIRWGSFVIASLIMAITPGANQLLSLRNGYHRGVSVAMQAASGRFSAFLFMIMAVAFGLGALLTASSVFFHIVKWMGVLYFIYLGIHMLRTSDTTHHREPKRDSVTQAMKQECMVAMSNPKAYLLFAVFLPSFISVQSTHIPALILIAGLAYIFIEWVCAFAYALAGWFLSRMTGSFDTDKAMNRLSGCTMIGLGAWLATEKPPTKEC